MHFPSFDFRDPVFDVAPFALSAQVVTLDNVYGLDPARVELERGAERLAVRCSGLQSGGGQQTAEGAVELRAQVEAPGRLRVVLRARAPEPIRCVKLVLRDLDTPLAVVEERGARAVGASGELLGYPSRLPLPCLIASAAGDWLGLRVEDPRVREKRFALHVERVGEKAGRGAIELVHEEDASRFAPEIETPPIVLARGVDPAAFVAEQLAFAERAFGLRPFEERRDVPAWARELALVVTLHGMHWTGRVFLDYAAMADVLEFVCKRIEGRRVLAYLPGWEGRYYWQYGDYRPEPRLGGEEGFARLCERARALGAHLMPMFGGNCANVRLPRFRALDGRAYLKSATGQRFHGNQPDWDFARAHDTGWQAWLNPGHPGWRETLASQIESLAARFGFHAVFLDTVHVWTNDPDHPVFEGIAALASKLRDRIPDLLLAAEHDYDALLGLFPLFQRAYWGADPGWSARYARRFAHLCEGEPEGRTGVHEFGVWKSATSPFAGTPGYLPTIAFQDDTLARSQTRVEEVIRAAAGS